MQRPKQEGLGAAFGAGVTDQIWGSQTTNVLQKGTVYLGVMFFVLSIALCVLEARKSRQFTGMKVPTAPVLAIPASPATPANTSSTPFEITPAPVTPVMETPAPVPAAETPAPVTPAAETPTPAEVPAATPAPEAPAPAVEVPAAPAEAPAK
jgi:protein translocase SecG subunit